MGVYVQTAITSENVPSDIEVERNGVGYRYCQHQRQKLDPVRDELAPGRSQVYESRQKNSERKDISWLHRIANKSA
ncbi:hypothetical protein GCM10027416_06020 [Okibacterium endophyticum]